MVLYMASEATPLTGVANYHSLRGTALSYSCPSCPTMSSPATCHHSRLNTRQAFPRYRRSNATLSLSRKVPRKRIVRRCLITTGEALRNGSVLRTTAERHRRSQDLRRHTRDKHQTPHKCPFCDTKWTRPEKIRGHLTTKHEDHFTEEELREVRGLRGLNDTVRYVAKCGMPKVPQQQHHQCRGPSLILDLYLADTVSVEPQGMRLDEEDGDLAPIGQDADSLWSL